MKTINTRRFAQLVKKLKAGTLTDSERREFYSEPMKEVASVYFAESNPQVTIERLLK